MRGGIAATAMILLAGLAACSPGAPDPPPLQAAFNSVQAIALPCRCPPGQDCPPCDPQYLVDARLRLTSASGDALEVRSFAADLYDVRAVRVASPQAWSLPVVPFSVAASGSDLLLSFLTGQGAEVIGGSVRVAVAGVDSRGGRWELTVSAPVTR